MTRAVLRRRRVSSRVLQSPPTHSLLEVTGLVGQGGTESPGRSRIAFLAFGSSIVVRKQSR